MLINDEDTLCLLAVFIAVLFVCIQQLRLPSIFHFLSAGNIIPDWFCQPNIKLSDCLCDLKVFSHEYLKKLWQFVSVRVTAAVLVLDRNEVTKLKFEGKTFHIYANQREVRA